jgi:hypothetical protein|tara:strand:- start:672 stop:890 length:219 start_codon:yes stop_codon:yes gene_type:complete
MSKDQNEFLGISENGKDTCISCEVETKYAFDTSIEYRTHYVEGAGQLCEKCYNDITGKLQQSLANLSDDETS